MKRLLYGWILFFCFCMGTGGGTTVAAKDNAAVRIVHVAGQLAESRQVLLRRTLTQAATEGAPAVVVVLSVTSGQERQAQQVSAVLAASSVPTIAYVRGANSAAGTAIALSCRHIIMAPAGAWEGMQPKEIRRRGVLYLKTMRRQRGEIVWWRPRWRMLP